MQIQAIRMFSPCREAILAQSASNCRRSRVKNCVTKLQRGRSMPGTRRFIPLFLLLATACAGAQSVPPADASQQPATPASSPADTSQQPTAPASSQPPSPASAGSDSTADNGSDADDRGAKEKPAD